MQEKLINIWLIIFLTLETLNVLTLYFKPGFDKGNGVGAFKGWEVSKAIPNIHAFIRYLVYWVAGTKLIFIGLLILILVKGTLELKVWTSLVMAIAIASYYWKLHPIIRSLDKKGEISPEGYSKQLGLLIGIFMLFFLSCFLYGMTAL